MTILLPLAMVAAFALLSLLHVHWACGGAWGKAVAVPEQDGRAVFTPSCLATGLVALGLAGCAIVVAALAGWLSLPMGEGPLRAFGYALALLFLARAIGDFRLVGFFKRLRGTRFAVFDTRFYSPLCLGLALGLFWLLHGGQT
jgi:Protein of unknown function (DUF3995)